MVIFRRSYYVTIYVPGVEEWWRGFGTYRVRARSAEEAAKAVVVRHARRFPMEDFVISYEPEDVKGALLAVCRNDVTQAFIFGADAARVLTPIGGLDLDRQPRRHVASDLGSAAKLLFEHEIMGSSSTFGD